MKVYLVIGAVVTALSGALWYSIERNLDTSAQLATAEDARDRQEQEANATKARLDEMTRERNRMAERIDRIRAVETRLASALESERATRARLEKENEAYRNWSRADLPDAVVRVLRQGPLHPDDGLPGLRKRQESGGGGGTPQPGNGES